jgi:hypothetical protein
MIFLRFRVLFLLGLLLLTGANAFAQTSASPTTQLALEIRYYPGQPPAHLSVHSSTKHGIWFGRFPRVAGWTEPANSLPVTAVNIKALQAEDGVRVWVSVFLGEIHEEEKQVSSYVLREGDTITANELADVGVVPFEFKVVRLAASAGSVPAFQSKAPSIELVSIQPNFSTIPTIQLVLRNVSSKPVHALEVQALQGGRQRLSHNEQGKEGAELIPPGGTFELTARLATQVVGGPNGNAPEALPNQSIEISSAVFADGSYEGDSKYAMTFLGFQKGRKAQLRRVLDLLGKAADGSIEQSSLKEKLAALNLDTDPAAIEELHRQFPQEKQIENVRTVIQIGMQGLRDAVLKDLSQFELHSRYSEANAFNLWLTSAKNRYQTWLSRL